MKSSRLRRTIVMIGATLALSSWLAAAHAAPDVTLTRLECGTNMPFGQAGFSDTYLYQDMEMQLTYSCYLIRHGDDYMVWNAGNPIGDARGAAKIGLAELLGKLKISIEQVKYLAISHWHPDHLGQASSFFRSTLLIGKGDWALLSAKQPPEGMGVDPKTFGAWQAFLAPWISAGGKVEPVTGDKDVFGDGSVVMLNMPGHTPGHHALLVRLKEMGNVLLSGDLAHFHENYADNGVPRLNSDRADTLASFDRFKKIAKNLQATVIIEHDPRDVGKLPAFPAAAK